MTINQQVKDGGFIDLGGVGLKLVNANLGLKVNRDINFTCITIF